MEYSKTLGPLFTILHRNYRNHNIILPFSRSFSIIFSDVWKTIEKNKNMITSKYQIYDRKSVIFIYWKTPFRPIFVYIHIQNPRHFKID